QHTQPRYVHAEPRFGVELARQQQQRLVHRAHQQVEHPHRDHHGHPDQQPGDEVALEEALLHCFLPLRNQLLAAEEAVALPPDSDLDDSLVGESLEVDSLEVDSLEADSLDEDLLSEASPDFSVDFFLLPLFLKSVAYQPVPFSWKPA